MNVNNLSVDEIKKVLKAHLGCESDSPEGLGSELEDAVWRRGGDGQDTGDYSLVLEQEHGGEGQGEDYWKVYSLADKGGNKTYFQFSGWYASYSGHEYTDGPTVVWPTPKWVTHWETTQPQPKEAVEGTITMNAGQCQVVLLPDGNISWNGRLVGQDKDVVAALQDFIENGKRAPIAD